MQKLNSNVVSIAKNVAEIWGKKVFVKIELVKQQAPEDVFKSLPTQIQTICNVFGAAVEKVIENLPETVLYINREQDLGDEGMRQAKMTYRPCGFINKYLAY